MSSYNYYFAYFANLACNISRQMGYKLFQVFSVERLDAVEGDRVLSSVSERVARRSFISENLPELMFAVSRKFPCKSSH